MQKLTAIIVGLGRQSLGDHIPALLQRKDVEIIGACDPSTGAQEAFTQAFPAMKQIAMAENLDKLLENVQPDIAIVAVPHDSYFEIAAKLSKSKSILLS